MIFYVFFHLEQCQRPEMVRILTGIWYVDLRNDRGDQKSQTADRIHIYHLITTSVTQII